MVPNLCIRLRKILRISHKPQPLVLLWITCLFALFSSTHRPIDLGSPAVTSKLLDVPNHLLPSRKNLPTRGHPSMARSTPPYTRSPLHTHSPLIMRKSPHTNSPSHTYFPSASPSLRPPKSPRQSLSPANIFHPRVYNSSPSLNTHSPNLPAREAPSPEPRSNPNAHRPPVISHSSPTFFHNGVIDTPPSVHIPSPHVSASPPGFPHMDLSLPQNGYSTPPLHLIAGQNDSYLPLPYLGRLHVVGL